MEKYRVLGEKTTINQRYINTEIKCVGFVCYYLVQSCFAFLSLFQKYKIKMPYIKLQFLAVVMYGRGTWSLK